MLAYQKGILISWNDDRGFGFIEPENKAKKVFIHISAFKKGGRRPQEGDSIHYQLDMDRKDRIQAINATIEGVNYQRISYGTHPTSDRSGQTHNNYRKYTRAKNKTSGLSRKMLVPAIIAIVFLILRGISFLIEDQKPHSVNNSTGIPSSSSSYSQKFSCRGKIHCSEMTSCAEATYYLRNCPGVKIDGDGDGIPCEDQWCGH